MKPSAAPRPGWHPSGWFRAVSILMLFVFAFQLNVRLEPSGPEGLRRHSLYIPSGRYLRFASLGFRHLLADGLYIWSIQYYSEVRAERWRYLARLYDSITDLDPRFLVAYSIGALILSLEAREPERALALLDKGIANNPKTYLLAWEAAFYARDRHDYLRTRKYLDIARSKPDAPPYVAHWYAATVDRLGRTTEALALWQGIYRSARSEYEREVAERWIHDLTLEQTLDGLRHDIEQFRRTHGRNPVALEELVRAGLRREVPLDPNGAPFLYDRKTGEVRSASSFLLRYRLKR